MAYSLYKANELSQRLQNKYSAFLEMNGLRDEGDADLTMIYTDDCGKITATGSLHGNVLKQIAVASESEGSGLCADVVTHLISEAVSQGETHLFIYSKPKNEQIFNSLGFWTVVKTDEILMMENYRNGMESFLANLPHPKGKVGAVVCNCNPFTLGHRYLIEQAAAQCDGVIVFVVSEDTSQFPAEDRYELVSAGTSDLKNVFVVRSGNYIVSRSTFPTYFIKEQDKRARAVCAFDVLLFAKRIAPALNISVRFVGEEPFDPVTREYNEQMKKIFPQYGLELREIPRYQNISASEIRRLLNEGRLTEASRYMPQVTYDYCRSHFR